MSKVDFEELRLLSYKLRCLGYFVETQDPDHVTPTDFDHVQYGFSMLINEIVEGLLKIAEQAENSRK